jgi:hypothetical protein
MAGSPRPGAIYEARRGRGPRGRIGESRDFATRGLGISEQNVGIVRRTLEAWQRDDFDGWLSGMDPTVEWHAVLQRLVEGPESVYRGHEGM